MFSLWPSDSVDLMFRAHRLASASTLLGSWKPGNLTYNALRFDLPRHGSKRVVANPELGPC